MKLRSILGSVVMVGFIVGAHAQKRSDSKLTLFTIGSNPVTVNEFVYLYKKNHQGKPDEFTKEKIEEYLDLFINFKLKVAEAESRHMDSAESFVKELNTYKKELKKPFVAESDLLQRLVKETYDRLGTEIKASHILINVTPEAEPADTLKAFNKAIDIRTRIVSGEDFEKLAREFSEDPSAKMNGGSLGYFSALQMVFPFEETAYNLKVGEVSQPTRTRFGYHIIKVDDKRPSSGEVEVSHILIRGAEEQSKKSIFEVYDLLQQKGDWNELCSKYSQDPGTKDSGGRLRPFGSGALASAPQFEEAAFGMNEIGSISNPILTPFGWHIIRLERKIPLPPFEELKPSLERRVAKDDRMTISKSIAVQKRKDKLGYNEAPMLKDRLESIADSSLVKGEWRLSERTGTKETDLLFTLGGSEYIVKNFADFIKENQSSSIADPIVYVQQLYDRYIEDVLEEAEDSKLQNENPEYRSVVNEYREGILLFSIMENEVWNKASEDSLGQRNYYEKNTERYLADVRVEARLFSAADKDFLIGVKTKIDKGDTLQTTDLKKFKSVVNFRAYEKGENKVIDSINWTVGVHEAEADGMYYLVEVSRLVPPGAKKFEEVRAGIISDYQDYLEKEWLTKLKNKYTIKMNSKGKKKAIAELTTKVKS